MTAPLSESELSRLETVFEAWLADELATNPGVDSVERDESGARWWYVRLLGEAKDVFTVRFNLQQRTLFYETYVMPAPEENDKELYSYLLRRNAKMYGASFCIGDEEAIFIQGQIAATEIDRKDELDRILGSLYVWVEDSFQRMIRIGFASKFSS
ncbi:MAG: YbjN domain-containing protein [Acidimicrobiales bacterium]